MTNTIKEYDNNGKLIHSRYSDGYEVWYDYDTNGNEIHSRDSNGYEVWREYDNNGKCIHYRDSTGREWRREYDTNGKLINTRNTSGATVHHHAAAEEKVRGECAAEQELAKVRGEYWEVVRKNLELLQRAERADIISGLLQYPAWEIAERNVPVLKSEWEALQSRAERAEAERDEAKKDAAMWKDIADMNYRGFKREKAKVADAIIALSAGDGGGEP
jgi:YD repeat-containing protein